MPIVCEIFTNFKNTLDKPKFIWYNIHMVRDKSRKLLPPSTYLGIKNDSNKTLSSPVRKHE